MARITGKKSPAEIAAQSVAKAVKSAINVAAAKAKAASTIGRTQKRYIRKVRRKKALEAEAEEDERMRKFWE